MKVSTMSVFRFVSQRAARCAVSVVLGFSVLYAATDELARPARADDSLWVEGNGTDSDAEIKLPSFAPVLEKLGRSVVNISIEGKEPGRAFPRKGPGQQGGPGFGDPNQPFQSPFDFFFQFPPDGDRGRTFNSLGSGFVIHPDGYIVTNQHVIDRATKIVVTFRDDRRTYEAKLIGSDPKTDIALLKVDAPEKLTPAALGNSDQLSPGDWVIAIGNPFRLGHTATVGIVSAKSRRVPGGKPYDNFIQTDASINPGNSGGPLFNARGEVIGINTAIFSPGRVGATGFNIGIGFATPINLVKSILPQLKSKGKVTRGWLGVLIQPVSEDVASALKLTDARGALVADVMPNSPAARAGFQRRDVILQFNNQTVNDSIELPLMVAETEVGKTVKVEIVRGGKKMTLDAKIDELNDEEVETPDNNEAEETQLGLTVQDLTPEIARGLGIEDDVKGVVVTAVEPDSPAAQAELKRGDVIVEVGDKPVTSTREFRAATKDLQKAKPLLLLVRRGDNTIFLTLKPE